MCRAFVNRELSKLDNDLIYWVATTLKSRLDCYFFGAPKYVKDIFYKDWIPPQL
jgi:hypothetical protein